MTFARHFRADGPVPIASFLCSRPPFSPSLKIGSPSVNGRGFLQPRLFFPRQPFLCANRALPFSCPFLFRAHGFSPPSFPKFPLVRPCFFEPFTLRLFLRQPSGNPPPPWEGSFPFLPRVFRRDSGDQLLLGASFPPPQKVFPGLGRVFPGVCFPAFYACSVFRFPRLLCGRLFHSAPADFCR